MARPAQLSGETLTVACKLPHGLKLRLFDMVEFDEAVAGGGFRRSKRAQPRNETVTLRGYLTEIKESGILMPSQKGSFALTHGVNKDFFLRWLRENEDLEVVKNHLVFAHESDTLGAAKEMNGSTKTGLDPLDPSNLNAKSSPHVKVTPYVKDDLSP